MGITWNSLFLLTSIYVTSQNHRFSYLHCLFNTKAKIIYFAPLIPRD
jgi:hypothetical protein